MKIAYIAHPISGDIEGNLKDIRRILRHINITHPDIVPFCPCYADIVSLDDNVPAERERGIQNDIAILKSGIVNELWLTGDKLSNGMSHERDLAIELGIPVIDLIGKI